MPGRVPVTACIIARDEASNLPDCIASLLPHVTEIVLVDTGSRDATVAIATRLGARVVHFAWIDDFSAARNFAATHATQAVIFAVDADERLDRTSVASLHAYCRAARLGKAGAVLRQNHLDVDGPSTVREHLTRLYPNRSEFRFEGRIHEQLRENGRPPQTVRTHVVLQHVGFRSEAMQRAD